MHNFYQLTPDEQALRLQVMAGRALDEWGITPREISLIKYRENAVFRVDAEDGQCFALRIHRPGYHDAAALRSELLWVDSLTQAGFDVPLVIPTVAGELCTETTVDAVPEPRQVDLFAWVEGEQLGTSEAGVQQTEENTYNMYRVIGQIAARLHNITTVWKAPEGFVRHHWDTSSLVGEQPFWGKFWELTSLTDSQRDLLLQVRESVRKGLQEYGKPNNRYSMIHADFVPENLLVDGEKIRLIDFDDAGYGWHMFELATALYFTHTEPNYLSAKQGLIDGYREHRDLPDSDWEKLDLFLLARSFTYLGWVHTRPETETAKELSPALVEMACNLSRDYLEKSSATGSM